tara:strand:+ start:2001 stop:2441 length:441 start_codon:yes stop_codon:yes gene_type:complete
MLPKYKDIIDLMKKGSTIEAQEQIMSLREGALELQEENQELKAKIKLLEEELKSIEIWEEEKLRYSLVAPFRGPSHVYALKKEKSKGEVPHFICANCFNNSTKTLLNQIKGLRTMTLECPKCSSIVETGSALIGAAKFAEDFTNEG